MVVRFIVGSRDRAFACRCAREGIGYVLDMFVEYEVWHTPLDRLPVSVTAKIGEKHIAIARIEAH